MTLINQDDIVSLISIVGSLLFLVRMCTKNVDENNKYGEIVS